MIRRYCGSRFQSLPIHRFRFGIRVDKVERRPQTTEGPGRESGVGLIEKSVGQTERRFNVEGRLGCESLAVDQLVHAC